MMRNKILMGILILILGACIKTYDPEFKNDSVSKWVIEGSITNQEGWQEVRISKTSSYNTAYFFPDNYCQVKIINESGDVFDLDNEGDGLYKVWISSEYLVPGTSYHLHVVTSDGEQFESTPDRMPPPNILQDAYYVIEDKPTLDPGIFIRGLQFYIDLNEIGGNNQYFRWNITETWEFHSAYPKQFWYDGEVHEYIPQDSSTYFCWATETYPQIFTLTTEHLDESFVKDIPLHFVSSETEKLAILYSYLIEQISMSEEAYNYWEQLKENVNIGEGLYASQPMAIQGNISNVANPDEGVLGFFSATSISSKRYFIEPIDGLELFFSDRCSPAFLRKGLREIRWYEYPAYLMSSSDGNDWIPYLLNNECVDCRLRGGKTEKPDFWL